MYPQISTKHEHIRHHSIKDVVVRARVSSELKDDVDSVLSHLGLTMSEAISIYLAQVRLIQGIPFDVKIPNKETAKAIREARAKKGIVVCKNAKDMFKKLGI
jgi:DNA-damage-inducible protein J